MSDVWEYLVSLPQVENAQNLYPNFSFTIVQVFLLNIKISLSSSSNIYMHNYIYKLHTGIHLTGEKAGEAMQGKVK